MPYTQNNSADFTMPATLQEFFAKWAKVPQAEPFSGDALLLTRQNSQRFVFPEDYIPLDNIAELKKLGRTERYLDLGSKCSVGAILSLGRALPEILRLVLLGSMSPLLQNLVSIGAAIFPKIRNNEIAAALTLLDARYELRSSVLDSRWIQASEYNALLDKGELSNFGLLLTRLRVPMGDWDYSLYKKMRQIEDSGVQSMTLLLLAKIHKDVLADIRIALSLGGVFRERGAENYLVGKKLPLDKKDTAHFCAQWLDVLDKSAEGALMDEMQKDVVASCLKSFMSHFID